MIVDSNASQLARKLARKAKRTTEMKLKLMSSKKQKKEDNRSVSERSDEDLSLFQVR